MDEAEKARSDRGTLRSPDPVGTEQGDSRSPEPPGTPDPGKDMPPPREPVWKAFAHPSKCLWILKHLAVARDGKDRDAHIYADNVRGSQNRLRCLLLDLQRHKPPTRLFRDGSRQHLHLLTNGSRQIATLFEPQCSEARELDVSLGRSDGAGKSKPADAPFPRFESREPFDPLPALAATEEVPESLI